MIRSYGLNVRVIRLYALRVRSWREARKKNLWMEEQVERNTKRAEVIAVGNQKGGVGKTTNTLHIAAALGEMGHRVLVIDLDANCGATKACGLGTDWLGTFEALMGEDPIDLIATTDPVDGIELPANVDLLPARRKLENFEKVCRENNKFVEPTSTLIPVVEKVAQNYDFVLLDTAPRADAPTVAAYRAADWFLLSTEPAKLSVEGLTEALSDIQAVRDAGNSELRLLGVVMCKVAPRTKIAKSYLNRIGREFESAGELGVFERFISRGTAIEGAQDEGKTLLQVEPNHPVAGQYRELTEELLRRLRSVRLGGSEVGEAAASREVVNG